MRKIEATAAIDVIIAGKAEELFVTAAAQQRVAEHRAHDGNDAGERIGADASRISRRRAMCDASRDVDGHTVRRQNILQPGISVAGDGVVAGHPFELVERAGGAGIGARTRKTGRIIDIVETGAAHRLDCAQRVGADTRVAGNCSGCEVDGDPRTRDGIVVVHGIVKSATTIEKVVSAATFKLLERAVRIIAAVHDVGICRPDNRVDEGEGVVTDGSIAIGSTGDQVHRNPSRRAHVGNAAQGLA